MKLIEIINAYRTLGEAKVTKLETAEVLKIVKARKVMRPYAEEFDAYLKDIQDKFRPESDSPEVVKAHEQKINGLLSEELGRDINIQVEPLADESVAALLQENGWKVAELALINPLL